jgi:hypothetical protein
LKVRARKASNCNDLLFQTELEAYVLREEREAYYEGEALDARAGSQEDVVSEGNQELEGEVCLLVLCLT